MAYFDMQVQSQHVCYVNEQAFRVQYETAFEIISAIVLCHEMKDNRYKFCNRQINHHPLKPAAYPPWYDVHDLRANAKNQLAYTKK